jgi:hypothetical protein
MEEMKNLLKKIINDEDLKATGFNMATAWAIGNIANTVANSCFHFNLNQYNSVKHFVMGVGVGTLAYRKAGKGAKGVLIGLAAATFFNFAWESFEMSLHPYNDQETLIDTVSDVAVVYGGAALSFVGEKFKDYVNRR